MWCVADLNEDYITKMEDVLETYEQPYDPQQPVVCLDEKPVTLHADVRPSTPAKPGREARRDNEYERCGTANVFCAVEPKAGRHFTFPTPDRSAFQFGDPAHLKPAKAPLLRKLIDEAFRKLFATGKQKRVGGETEYIGLLQGTNIKVVTDFSARGLQLRYGVSIPDETKRL